MSNDFTCISFVMANVLCVIIFSCYVSCDIILWSYVFTGSVSTTPAGQEALHENKENEVN